MTQRRWYGNPDEAEQPDVGDVVAHVARSGPDAGLYVGGPIYRVLAARPIRGREHEPHHLMLTVERGDAADLWPAGGEPAGGGRVFVAHACGSTCPCGGPTR